MIDEAITVILAGDSGPDLHPLTSDRAIPAIPFGGKYRIIDFPLANCLHSGLRKILVLTQYKSFSLQKHLRDGWSIFNPELGEYVTPVPPQMRHGERWYASEADAIFQNLYLLERSGARWVFVISANNIYRMDYSAMLKYHCEKNADVTIAGIEVQGSGVSAQGGFHETVDGRVSKIIDDSHAVEDESVGSNLMVNLGVTIFSMDLLMDVVKGDASASDSGHDFIKYILPQMLEEKKVFSYTFGTDEGRVTPDHYWCDINTIDTYYTANMGLLETIPPIELYQPDWPIRTYQPQSPPARTVPGEDGEQGISINSIVSGGVVIKGGSVQQSILSPNVFI
ncbi:MAG: sugar phosphate nucleotidyltransferase, partial [Porticoccus sp.]|nr:sugar phosphate nucleotidyltransferase [Porticoccus sp.]